MNCSIFERLAIGAAALSLMLMLAACGGGGSPAVQGVESPTCDPSDAATVAQCGNVLVAVTDAEGDFVSYTVDVLSLTLTRGDGGSIETLPATTRLDFAALTELSEIVSAATIVPGDIVGGSIRLDYSDAEIFVEAGGDILAADVVDEHGAPLEIVDLELQIADRDRLVVTRGRTALLSVDFDLAVSHEIDTAEVPPLVTARPYIVTEAEPIDSKEIRLRGALVDVDQDAGSYDVRVRPWHDRQGDHGIVTVHTTATTSFEIGEAMYEGAQGLAALGELSAGTMTVAFGELDLEERRFTAEIVHARDSVGGFDIDAVYGNVVARDGDRLTVKGALAVHRDRAARFRRTVIVTLGPGTTVLKRTSDALLDKDAISVGQRIAAFGTLADDTIAAGTDTSDAVPVLDATQGRVRMLVTRLHGSITSVSPGQIEMHLRGIDRLGIDMFDFTGTGIDPSNDADPAHYEIATGTLSLAELEVGKGARVLGFVTPFGAAPPDFEARTIVSHRDIPALLGIGWGIGGTSAPFLQMGPESLVPDLANPDIGERHHMLLGDRLVDLFDLPAAPAIVPSDGPAIYGIWEAGHIELFADFAAFVDELALRLSNAEKTRAFHASGRYDEADNSVTARRIAVHMIASE